MMFNNAISSVYNQVYLCEGFLKESGYKRLQSDTEWKLQQK